MEDQQVSFQSPDDINSGDSRQIIIPRELSFTEIMRISWTLYKQNFFKIIFFSLIVFVPGTIINMLFGPFDFKLFLEESFGWILPQSMILKFHFDELWNLIFGVFSLMGIAHIIKSKFYGEDISLAKAFNISLSKLGSGIITLLIMIVFLFGLFILLIIPGFIYMVFWSFALHAVALKDKSGTSALGYSTDLVKGNWWKVFGFNIGWSFLLMIILSLPLSLTGMMLSFLFPPQESLIDLMTNNISNLFFTSYWLVLITVLFVNLVDLKKYKETSV